MRRVMTGVAAGALGIGLVGLWAPAAHADGPFDVVEWDMATCATEGAASPVVSLPGPNGLYNQFYRFDVVGDGGEGSYGTAHIQRYLGGGSTTLKPLHAGDQTITVRQGSDETTPVGWTIETTAPTCPAGSPSPSDAVFPRPAPAAGDVSASFGEAECRTDDDTGGMEPLLPFAYANEWEGEGQMWVEVDGRTTIGTTLSPGSEGTQQIGLSEGEHTYEILGRDHVEEPGEGTGRVLDSVTATAPDCSDESGSDEPGGDEPGNDEPGSDEPGADDPGAGDDTSSDDAGDDSSDAGTDGSTPEIPSVVHTG